MNRPGGIVLAYAALVVLCGMLFFWRLGAVPLIGLDEALYAECSREMAASGNWLVPHSNGEPFFDKPPLVYWLQAALILALGPTSLAVRLQSAVSAALLVALVVFLGSRLFDRRAGLLAGFALASSLLTVALARLCLLDQLFALTIALALGAWLLVHQRVWSRRGLWSFWAAAGLSTMVKGPAALVMIGLVIFTYAAVSRQWKVLPATLSAVGLAVFAAIVLPWHIAVQNATGGSFLREFIVHQNLQRAMGKDFHHNQHFLFYVPVYLAAFLPWSVYIPRAWSSLVHVRPSDKNGAASLFLGIWLAVVIVLFSLLRSKLPSYIYPALPPSALLIGALFAQATEKGNSRSLKSSTIAAVVVCGIAGAAMLAGRMLLPKPIPGLATALVPMGIALIVGAVGAMVMVWKSRPLAAFGLLCGGASVMLLMAVGIGLPLAAKPAAEPARQIGSLIANLRPAPQRVIVYQLEREMPALPFYARRSVEFIHDRHHASKALESGDAMVVTPTESADDLPEGGRPLQSVGGVLLLEYPKNRPQATQQSD